MSPILSREQVAGYASQAGWPDDLIPLVVAVAEAESSLNTDAVNTSIAKPWPTGLMQVRPYPDRPSGPALKNPTTNLASAYKIFLAAGRTWGPNPWEVCSDGSCSNLAGRAATIAKELDASSGWRGFVGNFGLAGEAIATGELPEDTIFAQVSSLVSALGTIGDAITGFIGKLDNVDMWKRLGAGLGALALIVLGVILMRKDLLVDVIGSVPSPTGATVKALDEAVPGKA